MSDTAEPRTTEPDPSADEAPEEPSAETSADAPATDGGDDGPRDDAAVEEAAGDEAADEPTAEDGADDQDEGGAEPASADVDAEDASDEGDAEEASDDADASDDEDDEVEADPSRSSGRVKVFDEERNYGFVQPLEGGRDVFVHASEIEGGDALRPGDVVEYDLTKSDDGPQATSVRVLERAPEDNPAGRVVTGGAPPTWDQLERIQRDMRHQRRQRRRRR